MAGNTPAGARILGSLHAADGKGVVHIEDRIEASVGEVWAALTDPVRLAGWYGEVEGDLRPGGQYRARVFASGWEGSGRVEACEPQRRLVLLGAEPGEVDQQTTEVTLTADGDRTVLAFEQRGLPLEHVAAFGAGNQIHVEDLSAHLAGRGRCDADARWDELQPGYEDLARPLLG